MPANQKLPNKRATLWYRDGKKCFWCDIPTRLVNGHAWDVATKDHVIPRYKGGTDDDNNLVSACSLCNNRRCYEDQKGLPEGSMLGRYPIAKGHRGRLYASNRKRLEMSADSWDEIARKLAESIGPVAEFRIIKFAPGGSMDDDQKKKRQEETQRLQARTQKHLDRMKLLAESERIEFTRTRPKDGFSRDITIYYDALTDDQKAELERIDQVLFDMADEVTERGGTRTLKPSKED